MAWEWYYGLSKPQREARLEEFTLTVKHLLLIVGDMKLELSFQKHREPGTNGLDHFYIKFRRDINFLL
jgi:hypothetical protein